MHLEVRQQVSAAGDISVIIPYYNREQYIGETLQSVLRQTLKPLEIILVNDCSLESSRRYLNRYSDVCRIVDLPSNVGAAESRNAGVRYARGRFVAFLDDDDLWLPHKLEAQRAYMDQRPECAIVHSAAWFFYKDRPDEYYRRFDPGAMTLAQAITNEYWAIIPTVLVRTEVYRALGGLDVRFRIAEDRDFIIRCCAAGYQVEGISEPLVRVRREGQEGLTPKHWFTFREDLKMCWKHRRHYVRAYGLRGMLSFVLEKIQLPASKTRHVNRAVRFLTRVMKIKYKLRPDYKDPVLAGIRKVSRLASQWQADAAKFAGDESL
jgi:glycosyltransferase involved in cell wall biosynthesis